MLLVELRARIYGALQRMSNATAVDDKALNACLYKICDALLQADVQYNLVLEMQNNIKKIVKFDDLIAAGPEKGKIIRQALFDELCRMMDPHVSKPLFTPKKGEPSVVMFVGLEGSGKTTTCIKYAYHHQNKGWRPALVCADTFRTGAFDQLKKIATKANVPCYGSYEESDPVKIAVEGVEKCKNQESSNCDLIIVDTSGRHKQGGGVFFEELRQVSEAINPDLVILVVDANVGQLASDQVEAFRKRVAAVGGVIVTKMDGHNSKGAGALCSVAATKSPVIFFGAGQHLDELEVFYAKQFARYLLCMGALSGVAEKIGQPKLCEKILRGPFTLRIIYEWYQSILNSGAGFENIIESVGPGGLIPGESVEESLRMMKGFLSMMDSMTAEELDSPDLKLLVNNAPRIMQIARDSGHQVTQVMEMIETFQPIAKKMSNARRMLKGRGIQI